MLAIAAIYFGMGYRPSRNYMFGVINPDGVFEQGTGTPGPITWLRMKIKRQRQRFFVGPLLEPSVVTERIVRRLPDFNETMESLEILELISDNFPPLSLLGFGIIRAEYSPKGFTWPPVPFPSRRGFEVRDS
jgi:hypothetical protein